MLGTLMLPSASQPLLEPRSLAANRPITQQSFVIRDLLAADSFGH
jgi:hypothetical protein